MTLGGGYPSVEIEGDVAKMTFHLQNCMGIQDEDKVIEIKRKEIDLLQLPGNLPNYNYTLESRYVNVDIPNWGRRLTFIYHNYLETYSGGYSEESISGPYLEKYEKIKEFRDRFF